MFEFDITKAKSLIASGEFAQMKGQVENDWLECKGQPYQIQNEHGKRELAKDISSLANHAGGLILIGIRTQKSTAHFGDEIAEIRPLDEPLIDPGKYRNVIKNWLFPEPDGVSVSWNEIASSGKGVFVIEIPRQPDEKKPFLIRQTVDDTKNVEILFGYVERKKDNSQPISVEQMHSLVRLGLGFERIVDRLFAGIESQLDSVLAAQAQMQATPQTAATASPYNVDDLLKDSLQEARRAAGIVDTKFIFLCAAPEPLVEVESIFGSQLKGARWLIEHPPSLREGGWDIGTETPSQIVKGKLLRTTVPERKVLELHKNGIAVFSAKADQDFLCWGSHTGQIHPVALIEIVINFLFFYRDSISYMRPQPDYVHLVLGLVNLRTSPINHLVSYGIKSIPFLSNAIGANAPENGFEVPLRVPIAQLVPEKIAYALVREVYLWFGLEETKMPYVVRQNGSNEIDVPQLKSL
jgi:hypothetical protein